MFRIKYLISFLFLGFGIWSLRLAQPSVVLAAPVTADVASIQDLEIIFANIVKATVGLGGLVLFFTLIAGGFQWITAAGNPKALSKAQSTLGFAIIGFVLLVASLLILQLIKEFTGVDVTIFRVVQP